MFNSIQITAALTTPIRRRFDHCTEKCHRRIESLCVDESCSSRAFRRRNSPMRDKHAKHRLTMFDSCRAHAHADTHRFLHRCSLCWQMQLIEELLIHHSMMHGFIVTTRSHWHDVLICTDFLGTKMLRVKNGRNSA